ncbi:hypothetical protein C7H62_0486 [Mesoflavibacter sp. HG96]|uniref:hypothetical protein n=1 Tax=unclassified Mesoflavibacter TaxID=2630131 RepID=UPI000D1028C5|nr:MULTISPECIES: hypothetical protein [unclassified Mesoflavibacter]QIJ88295.1 hypothetical protein C7H62_0486 [Mesoflavibacter sp. HG96]QIJ91023.1 hypothetical protein C7H56_0486 [Mesoflavibacter sp. HG37]
MRINDKSIEKLRILINEETEYRSGPKLIEFFKDLGFNDSYGQGFPSRWKYTDDRLNHINGTPELDKCIKKLFNPVNFIGKISELDNYIKDFNQYLAFDKWQVIRDETVITFRKSDKVKLHDDKVEEKADDFLEREFENVSLEKLGLDGTVTDVLNIRFNEIKKCFTSKAHLSVIFMSGSTLEGILLGIALNNPKAFNQANSAPKNREGKVKQFPEWSLSQLIDTASELGLLKEDVKKFSHALRDFRNYIHPYQQVSSGFNPDQHTAKICFQVLKAAIFQLTKNRIAIN